MDIVNLKWSSKGLRVIRRAMFTDDYKTTERINEKVNIKNKNVLDYVIRALYADIYGLSPDTFHCRSIALRAAAKGHVGVLLLAGGQYSILIINIQY